MVANPRQRTPFESDPDYNYRAMWDSNFAWGIIALAMMLMALAIWALLAGGWYSPAGHVPVETPAVEGPSPVIVPHERAEIPAEAPGF